MVKIKEYFQVGNRDELTVERLLILLEDMYKDLATGINSQPSHGVGGISSFALVGSTGNLLYGNGLTSSRFGIGRYKLTFTTPQSDTNYLIVATPQKGDAVIVYNLTIGFKTLSYFEIKTKTLSEVFIDVDSFSVLVVN